MKTFLEFLTEAEDAMSGWTNIHTDKTVSDDLPHAKLVVRHMKDFEISEKEVRDAIEERNEYRKSLNLRPHPTDKSNLEDSFLYIFDGQYGRFYNNGWLRWHYADIAGESVMEFTSTIDTIQNGWHHIQKLAQQYNPEGVLVSNSWDDMPNAPGSYMLTFNGEDVKQGNFSL